jgi:DNA helicase MCM9
LALRATGKCESKDFTLISDEMEQTPQYCKDYQEIKIQEKADKLGMGKIPRSITVILEDDLVDTCKAGDDVMIT